MDQRGGCCIARYAGGAYDISKMDRIMLKFRPIAPKPASGGGSCSSASSENSSPAVRTGRGKRRNAAKKSCGVRKKRCSPENTDSGGSVSGGEKEIKTLPLLPEAPDAKATPKQRYPLLLSFENGGRGEGEMVAAAAGVGLHDPAAAAVGRRVVVASWVKVESVTDTWMVGCYPYGGIGGTDEERVRSLEVDTCPGFVTDGLNRVRWTNPAYRRMVAGGGVEVAVWLVVEEGVALPVGCAAGFTCRVRVVTCGNEKASKTVPCDVWRMDCGGFAWRLDTAAALSLWIGNSLG